MPREDCELLQQQVVSCWAAAGVKRAGRALLHTVPETEDDFAGVRVNELHVNK